jgi:hypothetical protein
MTAETLLRRLSPTEKVVRSFVRDGRLVSIPAKPAKRDVLLPWLLDACFPEDRPYEEKEVNQRLALWHPDVAALRRYLVEGRLMTREAGIYRRARPMAAMADVDVAEADAAASDAAESDAVEAEAAED